MSDAQEPMCDRHEVKTPTVLRTLHSDASKPHEVVALYECPDCGYEQRVPIDHLLLAEAGRAVP